MAADFKYGLNSALDLLTSVGTRSSLDRGPTELLDRTGPDRNARSASVRFGPVSRANRSQNGFKVSCDKSLALLLYQIASDCEAGRQYLSDRVENSRYLLGTRRLDELTHLGDPVLEQCAFFGDADFG